MLSQVPGVRQPASPRRAREPVWESEQTLALVAALRPWVRVAAQVAPALPARRVREWKGRSTIGFLAWQRAEVLSPAAWHEGEEVAEEQVWEPADSWVPKCLLLWAIQPREELRSWECQSGRAGNSSEWTWTDRAW